MPETVPQPTSRRLSEREDPVAERVRGVRGGLTALLAEAEQARAARAEAAVEGGAVCAWNHFENIPTFYNWNNRPR